jgi:hypothetical protein
VSVGARAKHRKAISFGQAALPYLLLLESAPGDSFYITRDRQHTPKLAANRSLAKSANTITVLRIIFNSP